VENNQISLILIMATVFPAVLVIEVIDKTGKTTRNIGRRSQFIAHLASGPVAGFGILFCQHYAKLHALVRERIRRHHCRRPREMRHVFEVG
jgi:hypothetical protein